MRRGVRTWVVEGTNDAGSKILEGLEGWMLRYSKVDTGPFLEAGQFPWTRQLEEGFDVIRRELDAVLEYREDLPNFQDISTDQPAVRSPPEPPVTAPR